MNQQLLEKDFEEIKDKIHQLELEQNNEENSWIIWLFRRNDIILYQERNVKWKGLKANIERKIELIKETKFSENTEYQNLLIKFANQLSKIEERIAKLEIKIESLKYFHLKFFINSAVIFLIIGFAIMHRERIAKWFN